MYIQRCPTANLVVWDSRLEQIINKRDVFLPLSLSATIDDPLHHVLQVLTVPPKLHVSLTTLIRSDSLLDTKLGVRNSQRSSKVSDMQ